MTRNVESTTGFRTALPRVGVIIFAAFSSVLWLLASHSQAHAASPITPAELNTQVSSPINLPSGQTQYNITGGTRRGGETNLFLSFGDFNVPTNNIANFLNDTGLATSNILGRVTAGNPSNIFGTIRTTDFGNANLFLMNPAGIVFGPNATLNVGGSVTFTTANYIRLADDAHFNATPGRQDLLLSASPVAAFGFLGPDAASIAVQGSAVQGSTLQVPEGQTISLIGGNRTFEMAAETATGEFVPSGVTAPSGVTVTGETLVAPSGRIYIASVDSAGEVIPAAPNQPAGLNVSSFSRLGRVELNGGAVVDVSTLMDADFNPISDLGNGSVHIRGGQFVMDGATINANNLGTLPGEPTAVSVEISGDATITNGSAINTVNLDAPGGDISITAKTVSLGNTSLVETVANGTGTGGAINVTAIESLSLDGAVIDSFSFGSGNGGSLNILAGQNVTVINGGKIQTTAGVEGNAGNITITAGNKITVSGQVDPSDPNTRSMISTAGQVGLMGGPGNINISAGKFFLQDNAHVESFAFNQPGGNIAIHADDLVSLSGGARVRLEIGTEPGGLVTITAPTITMDGASVRAKTAGAGNAGEIRFEGNVITLSNSEVNSSSVGSGLGGDVTMVATGRFTATGQFTDEFGNSSPSGVFSQAFESGNAGNISVTAPTTEITNGARIDSSTFRIGNAGAVTVTTDSLLLTAGGRISSSSSFVVPGVTPTGAGGSVTIEGPQSPAQSVLIDGSGSGIFTNTQGTGAGGNILIETSQSTTLTNGAAVSASSTGTMDDAGDAGMVTIHAGNTFFMQESSVTTEATKSGGGQIEINATNLFQLVHSTVSSSVLDGTGGGGNINIDPNLVVLQNNSQILARAIQGAGGNITIFTPLFLADQSSLVSASSPFGLNGTVTIQSPTSNLSGSLGPLASKTNQAQSLVTQRCAALANGQASSFVVAGREQLPADPGSWLTSPLALAGIDAEDTSNLEPRTSNLSATGMVSLRRLTPTRFLMANFAESEATGCHS